MNDSELLSLFGYYLAVIAFLFAFFSNEINAWRQRVQDLVNEWQPGAQKVNSVFGAQQKGRRKTLNNSKPYFALWAPVSIAVMLLGLGCYSVAKSAAAVDRRTSSLLLVLPGALILLLHVAYGCYTIRKQKKALEGLQ